MNRNRRSNSPDTVFALSTNGSRAPGVHHADPACGGVLHPGGMDANYGNYGTIMRDVESPKSRRFNGPQLTPPYRRGNR